MLRFFRLFFMSVVMIAFTACGGGGGALGDAGSTAQEKAIDIIKAYASGTGAAPTASDYRSAIGNAWVTDTNVAQVNAMIANLDSTDVDSVEDIKTAISDMPPVIVMNPDEDGVIDITIQNQNDDYIEWNATATDIVDGVVLVVITGEVNTSKAGDYNITYNAKDSDNNPATPAIRKVRVKDTEVPLIVLNGAPEITIAAYSHYADLNATVTDNVDADRSISSDGIVTVDTNKPKGASYTITYAATDVAGNSATNVTRRVNVDPDSTPPELTLNGGGAVITKGHEYVELNATAVDRRANGDVNLTASIEINSTAVDTSVVGQYEVKYSVEDAAGNETNVTRVVMVIEAGIKKTGQQVSYEVNGSVSTTGIKDDGNYTSGKDSNYSRDDANDIVIDHFTGLMWQDDDFETLAWQEATDHCEALTLGGYTDWRLPTAKELGYIVDRTKNSPSIDGIFVSVSQSEHWTSGHVTGDDCWTVEFAHGITEAEETSVLLSVRCVRVGQP